MQEHREDDDRNDATDFDPALNYVDILGVSGDAGPTDIKRRYGSRAKTYHLEIYFQHSNSKQMRTFNYVY